MFSNLHFLRAVSTLVIVYFHAIVTSQIYGQAAFLPPFLMALGEFGVDCFFAVSGFVLVFSQQKAGRSARDFIKNRLLRIIPIYWAMTIFLICIFLTFPDVFKGGDLKIEQILASLFFMSGFTLDQKPLLYVGWTLEYEMLFYWLLAAGLLIKNKKLSFWVPVLVLIVLSATASSRIFFIDFIIGMMCAWLFINRVAIRYGALFFLGAIFWLVSLVVMQIGVSRPWTALPAFMLVFGLINVRQVNIRVVNYIGDASYSIYLGQVFSIPAFYKISSKFLIGFPADLLAVFALVVSCIFGCFIYQFVEKPLGAYLKSTI